MRIISLLFLLSFVSPVIAVENDSIRVHFLYGSAPKGNYKDIESKWFGGKLGGHVGVEIGDDRILNFVPSGKFHVFQNKEDLHSLFAIHSFKDFYSILGGESSANKKVIFTIPINAHQRQLLDSLTVVYLRASPYDYAFFGMRCAAATYDILSRIGILEHYNYSTMWKKIFYPKQLRNIMFEKARVEGWSVETYSGSPTRKWEHDK